MRAQIKSVYEMPILDKIDVNIFMYRVVFVSLNGFDPIHVTE